MHHTHDTASRRRCKTGSDDRLEDLSIHPVLPHGWRWRFVMRAWRFRRFEGPLHLGTLSVA